MGDNPFNPDALMDEIESDDNDPDGGAVGITSGDPCPEDECAQSVHEIHNERNPQLGSDPVDSYSEYEYVCVHHGIVAST